MNYKDYLKNKGGSAMAKEMKSLSVKTDGEFVDAINSYCLENGMSVAGVIIDLLVDFYNDNLELKANPSYDKGWGDLKDRHYAKRTKIGFKRNKN